MLCTHCFSRCARCDRATYAGCIQYRRVMRVAVTAAPFCGLLFLIMIFAGCEAARSPLDAQNSTSSLTSSTPMPEPLTIKLTGQDHRWTVQYQNAAGVFSAPEALQFGSELVVPVGTPIVLALNSSDYIYTLAIPEFGLKEIAVPRLDFHMNFCAADVGQFPLVGDELCGAINDRAEGRLIVEPRDTFYARWRRKKW